jgi:hypothetical protein
MAPLVKTGDLVVVLAKISFLLPLVLPRLSEKLSQLLMES